MCGIGVLFLRAKRDINRVLYNKEHGEYLYKVDDLAPLSLCSDTIFEHVKDHLQVSLRRRGPDHYEEVELDLGAHDGMSSDENKVLFMSSVLNIRRTDLVKQPLRESNLIFQWNGECYPYVRTCSEDAIITDAPSHTHNDTLWVQKKIKNIVDSHLQSKSDIPSMRDQVIVDVVHFFENPSLKGSYAFSITIPQLSLVLFGRDKVGRRSLVRIFCSINNQSGEEMEIPLGIASVGCDIQLMKTQGHEVRIFSRDVDVSGVHTFHLKSGETIQSATSLWNEGFLRSHPFSDIFKNNISNCPKKQAIYLGEEHKLKAFPVPSFAFDEVRDTTIEPAMEFVHALYESVAERFITSPIGVAGENTLHVSVLFSGGVDCMLLAALLHWVVEFEFTSDDASRVVIELLNVSFGDMPEASPDRISARLGYKELQRAFPNRNFQLFLVNASDERIRSALSSAPIESVEKHIEALVSPSNTVMDVNISTALWYASAGVGVVEEAPTAGIIMGPGRLHRIASVIEKNASDDRNGLQSSHLHFDDLIMALKAEHTASINNFSEAHLYPISLFGNEPYKIPYARFGFKKLIQYMRAAERHGICRVTLDKSKNYWISSFLKESGIKDVSCEASQESLKSLRKAHARLVFSGLGADELCAGYRRHRSAYHSKFNTDKSPCERLLTELNFDCSSLWKRNCGRDDRIISDQGKELALPFLDENVIDVIKRIGERHMDRNGIKTCNGLIWDMNQPEGIGDKKVVRTAARIVGLTDSSCLVKRAIQFGSRIANRKIKGELKVLI